MAILNSLSLKRTMVELKRRVASALMCLVYPVHILDQKFEDFMDLLLIMDDNKSYYVYIKNFNRFMSTKTKHKTWKM